MSTQWDNDEVVKRFREYLRIKTVPPNVNYTECVDFLKKQASYVGLPEPLIYEPVEGKPVVLFTWKGTSPDLPSIILISHMVVAPADESISADYVFVPLTVETLDSWGLRTNKFLKEIFHKQHWDYPPFEAHITKDGWIYGRGSQGAKSVGLMYLEALKNLKETGYKPKTTVHICFSSDADSTRAFVETQEFRDLNVGFALYESIPSNDTRVLVVLDKARFKSLIKVTCKGKSPDVSTILTKTTGDKITFMIEKFMDLRKEEIAKLQNGAKSDDIKAINMMKLDGGDKMYQFTLPDKLLAYFHISVSREDELPKFHKMVDGWCKEAGNGVTAKNILDKQETRNDNNKFFEALKLAVQSIGLDITSVAYLEATVSSFFRGKDIPAIGFTPLLDTPVLVNDNNERVHVDRYKQGIKIMQTVIEYIAKV